MTADDLRLLSVHQVIGGDSRAYWHLAIGYQRGSPWRFDSVYLLDAAFELVDPPFRDLPRFLPHGVTVLAPHQVPILAGSIASFADRLQRSPDPGAAYGERVVFKPGLRAFPSWEVAKPGIVRVLAQLGEWVDAQALDAQGITVYPPGR